jgi:hypothetical protein
MTFRQALKSFRARFVFDGDKPAARQAWVVYVDGLHRDGLITDKQAKTWDNPF